MASALDLLVKRDISTDIVPDLPADGNVYVAMLSLIEKQFENLVDANAFEEQARYWFGTSAYVSYTMDKLFHGICKQLTTVVNDQSSIRLYQLFEQSNIPVTTGGGQENEG